jgi:hypothetical protein
MRASKWLAAVVLGLGLAGSAPAQTVNFGSFGSSWSGGIVNQPTDVSTSTVPLASPLYRPNRTVFNTYSFMPHSTRMNNNRVQGFSAFPNPSQMPGTQYLQSFNYYRPPQTLGLFSWLWPFSSSQQMSIRR